MILWLDLVICIFWCFEHLIYLINLGNGCNICHGYNWSNWICWTCWTHPPRIACSAGFHRSVSVAVILAGLLQHTGRVVSLWCPSLPGLGGWEPGSVRGFGFMNLFVLLFLILIHYSYLFILFIDFIWFIWFIDFIDFIDCIVLFDLCAFCAVVMWFKWVYLFPKNLRPLSERKQFTGQSCECWDNADRIASHDFQRPLQNSISCGGSGHGGCCPITPSRGVWIRGQSTIGRRGDARPRRASGQSCSLVVMLYCFIYFIILIYFVCFIIFICLLFYLFW